MGDFSHKFLFGKTVTSTGFVFWGGSVMETVTSASVSALDTGGAKSSISDSDAEVHVAVRQLAAQLMAESMRSSPLPPAMFNISGGAAKGVAGRMPKPQ